jgi:hypothetical protein
MRNVTKVLIPFLFLSCGFNKPKTADNNLTVKNDFTFDTAGIAQIRLTNPADYHKLLDSLDQGDLTSLDIAGALFKNCVADTTTCDSMFVVLSDFFHHMALSYLENNESASAQLESSPYSDAVHQLKLRLASYGIRLCSTEGTFYLEPQTSYLLLNFGPELSSANREYLTIKSNEQQAPFAKEGTILIPSDSLISRILLWENFIARYPRFISMRSAQDQYAQYLGAFLAGMDNSRVFDSQTNQLNDSSKTAFERFIVGNPESRSAGVVQAYLDLLRSTSFNYTEKVDSFLIQKVYSEEAADENN